MELIRFSGINSIEVNIDDNFAITEEIHKTLGTVDDIKYFGDIPSHI